MKRVLRFLIALVACNVAVATAFAGSSQESFSGSTSIAVHMTEYTFTLSANSAPVGTVFFKVTNDGKAPHNFSIAGRTTPDLAPGASSTLSVNFTTAGAQPYLCTLPGHAQAGMQGTFTARGSSATVKPTAILNATEKEWRINLTTSTGAKVKSVKRGLIRFKVRNAGVVPHNFVIAKHQTILVESGRRAVLNVSLRRGRYRYICSIAGHAAKGMKGVLVVT